ncbi:hypothetical protein [Streptomyces sp. NPDC059015]|uniref:hypothetical protein n=1 Tax=unclassified Streptomyces TaxID=2593676 RepID=UPI0036B02263
MAVEISLSAISLDLELPFSIRLGEVEAVVGTIALPICGGELGEWRPVVAAALREVAEALEDPDVNTEGVDGAAP